MIKSICSPMLALALLGSMAPVIHAQSSPVALQAVQPVGISQIKQQGAKDLAALLTDREFREALNGAFTATPTFIGTRQAQVSLRALAASTVSTLRTLVGTDAMLRDLDRAAIAAKGLEGKVDSALQLRLYMPSGSAVAPEDVSQLWIAVATRARPGGPLTVTAYDAHGGAHALDPNAPPSHPMLILETNGEELMRAGMQLVNSELDRAGFQQNSSITIEPKSSPSLTVLTNIRLKDDQEPWISGDAEVFAVVSGIQSGASKPQIATVHMPWLDNDQVDYTPFQDMVYWKDYAFGAVNIQLFEQDDETNYRDLAKALLDAAEKALQLGAPEYSFIPKIGQAILAALPDSWLTNDNDYIDSYYLIEQGKNYSGLDGAARNAKASFCSYVIGAENSACQR